MSSSIVVQVDRTEYSQFVNGYQKVNVTITPTNAQAGETLTCELVRLDGYGQIATQTLTLTANQGPTLISFDLTTALDAYGFRIARHGWYNVEVTSSTGPTANSPNFYVTLVTLDELKGQWCHGVPFNQSAQQGLVNQPQQVTGVTVTHVPPQHRKGVFGLDYVSGVIPTLAWDGGTPVSISNPNISTYTLLNKTQSDYVVVKVVPQNLPSSSVTEPLVVDTLPMDDDWLRNIITMAQGYCEQELWYYAEPTYISTDPNTLAQGPETNVYSGWADHTAIPQSYYRPRDFMRWMSIVMPYNRLLKVLNLTGYFNATLTLDVTLDWIVWNETNGEVELVPSNGAIVTWQFYESAMLQFLYIYNHIPSFWHYWLISGLRHDSELHAPVRELIAKKAAYDAIAQVGQAYAGGLASRNTSRDGVSGNVTYQNGYPWAELANQYAKWVHGPNLDNGKGSNLLKLRKRGAGPQFIVV